MNSSSVMALFARLAGSQSHCRFSISSPPPLALGIRWSNCAVLSNLRPVKAHLPRCFFQSRESCCAVALLSPRKLIDLIQKNRRAAYLLAFAFSISMFRSRQTFRLARTASGLSSLSLAIPRRFFSRRSSSDIAGFLFLTTPILLAIP